MPNQLPEDIRRQFDELPEDADSTAITKTADTLQTMTYRPVFVLDTPGFFTFTKEDLEEELLRVAGLPDAELTARQLPPAEAAAMRQRQMSMLLYHYSHLQKLREGDPNAWDTVVELSVED